MTDTDELRRDVDRALARLALYETVLRNLADGYWNAGRAEPITASEYAREALDPFRVGATDPAPWGLARRAASQ